MLVCYCLTRDAQIRTPAVFLCADWLWVCLFFCVFSVSLFLTCSLYWCLLLPLLSEYLVLSHFTFPAIVLSPLATVCFDWFHLCLGNPHFLVSVCFLSVLVSSLSECSQCAAFLPFSLCSMCFWTLYFASTLLDLVEFLDWQPAFVCLSYLVFNKSFYWTSFGSKPFCFWHWAQQLASWPHILWKLLTLCGMDSWWIFWRGNLLNVTKSGR